MLISLLDVDRYILSFFNGSESVFVDGVVTILTSGFTWVLLYLVLFYIVIKNNDTMSQIGITIGCVLLCLLFADGLADGIVKPLVARPRPLNDPFIKHTIRRVVRTSGYGACSDFRISQIPFGHQ